MKKRRILSAALALLLAAALPVSALAAEYDLSQGSVTIEADAAGQRVSQNGHTTEDDAPVITQSDPTTATENHITVSTEDGATASFTIRDLNIVNVYDDVDDVRDSKPAIDIGDSSAVIQVEGTNSIQQDYDDYYAYYDYYGDNALLDVADGDLTLTSETGGSLTLQNVASDGAVIGSGYEEDFTGSIHVTGDLQLTAGSTMGDGYGAGIGAGYEGEMRGTITIDGEAVVHAAAQDNGAGIGSGEYGAMSGTITIGGNAQVTAWSEDRGAGIGSGEEGAMSGTITIGGNAQVTATSDNDGAGIGSGQDGDMRGTITIGGNAQVTAWSEDRGAGIGSGEDGAMRGTIRIGGNAQVTAGSADDSAGIGAGEKGSVSESGQIILCDDAKVTAIGEDEGAGIGAGEDHKMAGLILIRDRAQVTAIAGSSAAAIGSDDEEEMTGSIVILGDAVITTGVGVEDRVWFNEEKQQIQYVLKDDATGYIGDSSDSNHGSSYGQYVIGPGVTINGVPGADTEKLQKYVNMQIVEGETKNLTILDVEVENGLFTAKASGAGAVLGIYYGGSKTVPTEPGSYTVTCLLNFGDGNTLTVELGTYVVAEAETEAPLYRVLDEAGRDTAYTAEQSDGVLTITVDRAYAVLTARCDAMETLRQQGVETIVFVTKEATSTFALADLLEKGTGAAQFHLTHVGPTVTFTLGDAMTDISAILA